MTFKDEILQTLFGGGTADYEMLEKCNYAFEDILDYIKSFTSVDEMEFNDILLGAIDLYRSNIEEKIEEKKKSLEENIKYLENKMSCCASDKYDEMELLDNQKDLEKLEELSPFDDIEYNTNYLDTQIWVLDDDTRAIYKELLADEISKENDEIGFVELDLD